MSTRRRITATIRIIPVVCRFFGLTPRQFLHDGRNQHRNIQDSRHVAMWLLHMRGMSYPEIARTFGLGHHTTCLYGALKVRSSEWLHACALAIDEWLERTIEHERRAA